MKDGNQEDESHDNKLEKEHESEANISEVETVHTEGDNTNNPNGEVLKVKNLELESAGSEYSNSAEIAVERVGQEEKDNEFPVQHIGDQEGRIDKEQNPQEKNSDGPEKEEPIGVHPELKKKEEFSESGGSKKKEVSEATINQNSAQLSAEVVSF